MGKDGLVREIVYGLVGAAAWAVGFIGAAVLVVIISLLVKGIGKLIKLIRSATR